MRTRARRSCGRARRQRIVRLLSQFPEVRQQPLPTAFPSAGVCHQMPYAHSRRRDRFQRDCVLPVPCCAAASLGAQVQAPAHAPPRNMYSVRGLFSCTSVCVFIVPGAYRLVCCLVVHGYLGSVCGFLLAAACMHDCTPKSIPPVSEIALTPCSPVQGGMGRSGGPGNAGVGGAQSLKS